MIHEPMTRDRALIFVFLGCASELIAILGKQFYYGRFGTGRPAPLWLGRLMFGFVGLVFLFVGFRFFFFGY